MVSTAEELTKLNLESIKIHPLHVVKGTTLEKWYNLGNYKPFEMNEYVDYLVSFLEHLGPTS